MSDRVKPAMTKEEWAMWEWDEDAADVPRFVFHRQPGVEEQRVERYADSIFVRANDEERTHPAADLGPDDMHALAALCLHGQPFGFTWEMVHAMRTAADGLHSGDYNGDNKWSHRNGDLLNAAADRIAALLPPREGG